MLNRLARGTSWIASHWRISAAIAGAVAIAAAGRSLLETEQAKAQRAEHRRKQELRTLADRISIYGRNVHQRYPTGEVVVSERDLAERFRKRPDAVATALHLLWGEQKVQRAPLDGYWKLNA
jgi:hypothetical protein